MPTSRGRLEDVILIGTRADQPLATDVAEGTLYSVTDENNLVERANGVTWDTYADAGSGGGDVTAAGTLTADMVILGNGGTVVKALAAGTAGQVLAMNGGATAAVWTTPAGSGDVVGPAASVDKEIALFDGTTGKLLERATGTGYVKVTSGVMGTPAATVPVSTDVGGLGTGVATALGVNVGSAGAPVVQNGALGTPSSGTASNLTGLPLTTGVTGTLPIANGGTANTTATAAFDALAPTTTAGDTIFHNGSDNVRLGIGTALQVLRTNAGATAPEWATLSGGGNVNAGGTLASGALVIGQGSTDVATTTTGTGVVTALGVNVGSAGAVVVNGGALGTPASGTLTNTTGFPTANLAGLGANVATFLATPSSANLAAAVTDETGSGALVFGTSPIITTDITIPNTGLHLLDTNASHDLIIAPGSNLTADHTLTITTGDSDRTLTLSGNSDISGTNSGDVTLAGTPTYITIAGQVITRAQINLTTDVTGDLPYANLAQGTALSVLGVTGNATADNASIAAASDHQVVRRSGTAVAFGAVNLAQSAAVTGTLPSANLPAAVTTKAIGVTIDGGGSTITTGIKCDVYVPFTCTITAVTLLADQTGSIVIDIWGDPLASYPPTDADSITAAAPPTITTNTNSQDTTLTGWQTTITAGDTLRFNVDSATSIQRVNLTLTVTA